MRHRLVAALTTLFLTLGTLAVLTLGTAPAAFAATQVIPIPTSASGAESIVASPDGTLWFVEREANKVGRVNTNGTITEFTFPRTDASQVEDLDVGPDGSVWVIYDSGRRIRHITAAGAQISDQSLGAYPYGEQVRVEGSAAVVTMAYDQEFVSLVNDSKVVDLPNSPECADALGRGNDGSFWCRTDSGLTRLNISSTGGGTTYPANDYAAYPFAIAPGPVGSIWFGRYQRGSFAFSPSEGSVGYLDAGSGAITSYDTGDRTAINSLLQGPDGNMWFTSIGAAKGIGHIAPNGSGGTLTAIGNYAPNSVAFGRDGAVYATDADNNVVIKTSTADLQVTNVDPGEGSVLTGGAAGGFKVKAGKKPVVVKQGAVPLKAVCAKDAGQKCVGKAKLTTTGTKAKAVSKAASFKLKPGKKGVLRLKLTAKGLKTVKKGKATKLQLQLFAKGSKAPYATQVVKVRR